jgi:hypothetical protein
LQANSTIGRIGFCSGREGFRRFAEAVLHG